jgi:hypothetical protein
VPARRSHRQRLPAARSSHISSSRTSSWRSARKCATTQRWKASPPALLDLGPDRLQVLPGSRSITGLPALHSSSHAVHHLVLHARLSYSTPTICTSTLMRRSTMYPRASPVPAPGPPSSTTLPVPLGSPTPVVMSRSACGAPGCRQWVKRSPHWPRPRVSADAGPGLIGSMRTSTRSDTRFSWARTRRRRSTGRRASSAPSSRCQLLCHTRPSRARSCSASAGPHDAAS